MPHLKDGFMLIPVVGLAGAPRRFSHRGTRMIRSLFANALALPALTRPAESDPLKQMAMADAADRGLLRLVACAAVATLVLAAAASLS
jgi:hypothetical protein